MGVRRQGEREEVTGKGGATRRDPGLHERTSFLASQGLC